MSELETPQYETEDYTGEEKELREQLRLESQAETQRFEAANDIERLSFTDPIGGLSKIVEMAKTLLAKVF